MVFYDSVRTTYQRTTRLQKTGFAIGVCVSIYSSVYFWYRFSEKRHKYNAYTTSEEAANNMDLSGKYAIITRATSGIGKETVRVMVKHGCTVIMACKNHQKSDETKRDLIRSLKKDKYVSKQILSNIHGRIQIIPLDLGSLKSIEIFCKIFIRFQWPLHYLIKINATQNHRRGHTNNDSHDDSNDAINDTNEKNGKDERIDSHFGVHFVGPFYLTQLLLPRLIENGGRIIEVAFATYAPHCNAAIIRKLGAELNAINNKDNAKEDDVDVLLQLQARIYDDNINNKNNNNHTNINIGSDDNFAILNACNLLIACELSQRYHRQGIGSVALHPGYIRRNREISNYQMLSESLRLLLRFGAKSCEQGCATIIRCISIADNHDLKPFYFNCRETQINCLLPKSLSAQLWRIAENVILSKGFSLTVQ